VKACPRCGSAQTLVARPGHELTSAGLMVAVESRRGLRCGQGHVDRSLPRSALLALDRQTSTARRSLFGREDCGACRTTLDLPARDTTRHVTVEPDGGPPFTLTLSLPVSRCPGCGLDNLSAVTGRRLRAMVHRLLRDD